MRPLLVIAPDKFKGSLSAWEAAQAIARGLRRGGLGEELADMRLLPIADGGEGTSQVILQACGGEWVQLRVSDALGRAVEAGYALLRQEERSVAVMEMSQAAGLWRLEPGEFGRRDASTRGVGELMRDAGERGVDRILLGLGGSATNDGGTGMAQALGIRFFDREGCPVTDLPRKLERVDRVDLGERVPLPEVVAACDVSNPLLGPRGCSRVFGPQKGIREEEMAEHEAGLAALAEAVRRSGGEDWAAWPGAGAAGGMGFGCLAFAGARLEPGFAWVAGLLGLEEAVRGARVVITGEGSLDRQTLDGKGPHGVVKLARRWAKPVLAFCGVWDGSAEVGREFEEIRALRCPDGGREESMRRAGELLEEQAEAAVPWVIRQIAG